MKETEYETFCKRVTWYLNCNNSWAASYNTKHFAISVAGEPDAPRRKVQQEVLTRLYDKVKLRAQEFNVPLFD